MNDYLIEKAAAEFRSLCQLGDIANIDLESLLLKLNIVTVFLDLSQEFSGMSLKINDENKFMLINSSQNIGRQNFTIGHELYHLFIEKDFKAHQCRVELFQKKSQQEFLADSFSANFLMPRAGILALIPEDELKSDAIILRTVLYLENYYKVSRLSLLYRLKSMGLIGDKSFEELKKEVIKSAYEYGYNDELYKPGNQGKVIGNYGSMAKLLFNGDKISESHYFELMKAIELKKSSRDR